MGPNDNPKDYNVTKDIAKRRVYPEYEQPNGGAHTNKCGKGKLSPGNILYTQWYSANELTIIAKGFFLQAGGRIPADVCQKVERYLDNLRDRDDDDE